jgi:hypothetical protein
MCTVVALSFPNHQIPGGEKGSAAMHNDLIPYITGEARPRSQDRALVSQARGVYNDVRLAALKADGAMALGAHIMEGAAQLDAHRRALAGNDPALNAILCEIELSTVRQAQIIQRQTFNLFGI